MDDTLNKTLCLIEELETAKSLIVSGFGELQEIRMGNDFYHLPQLLLAGGFERLMKCYICLVYEARSGEYPSTEFLRKSLGHDLKKLKGKIIDEYFNTNCIPLLQSDLEFIKKDILLDKIISVLSELGQKARYYNLDIVTGSKKPPIDPKREWEELEREIEDPTPYLSLDSMERLERDYYPRVNAKIIAKLERQFRSIAMQFTLGQHGGKLKQFSPILSQFIVLRDAEFGTTDYRNTTKMAIRTKDNWHKRKKVDALKSKWPSTLLNKDGFQSDWPFRSEEVVVELREKIFYVINIEGYDFALNGAAQSRFGYPYPHDTGMAILGKSIGPFIEKAFLLNNEIS